MEDRVGSPPLDEDEWILLLDLYMRRKPNSISVSDPELAALSTLLSRRAKGESRSSSQWRSPAGLRARTSVFRVLDPDIETIDSKRTAMSDQVWERFSKAPGELAKRAERLRAKLQYDKASDRSGDNFAIASVAPSRGPSPWSGSYSAERLDGDRWVYLMVLGAHGACIEPPEPAFIKIGRSGNVEQRARDLNSGFPPGLGLRWEVVHVAQYGSEEMAASVEQAILLSLRDGGLTIGGEFARCSPAVAIDVFHRVHECHAPTSASADQSSDRTSFAGNL